MKRQLYFLIVIFTATVHLQCQTASLVRKVEFTSLTRGFQKHITVSADSIRVIIQGRAPEAYTRKIAPNEWKSLQKTLAKVKITGIPDLPSPTMKRAYDGALHSAISVTTTDGLSYVHSFDDEDPHDSLKPLLKRIQAIGQHR